MRLLSLSAVVLAQVAVSLATLTLSEVEAQIESFQDQNGTHVARSAPQFGCSLAVSSSLAQVVNEPKWKCVLIDVAVWLFSLQQPWKAVVS